MFTGFSPQTFDFLLGLMLNNHPLWFEAHKREYKQYLQTPLQELSRDVFARFSARYPDRDFFSKVARIRKDARIYHGNEPYRHELWFSIRQPAGEWQDAPTFWFSVQPNGWCYGLGLYAPAAATMARHREMIDRYPARVCRLYDAILQNSEFMLESDNYARKKPCREYSLVDFYNCKNMSFIHRGRELEPLYSPQLPDRIAKGFASLMPVYDYLFPLCEGAQGPA